MEDLEKKEALREVLKDVQNAHKLIIEYQERILHIIEFIRKKIDRSYDVFHYPNREIRIYGDITEFFFGSKDKKEDPNGEHDINVFRIILTTGDSERKQPELMFILDKNGKILLPGNNCKVLENYLYNIINRDEAVLNDLEKEDCEIQRRNIEDFYDEKALKNEWEKISKDFSSCWINNYEGKEKKG